MSVDLDNPGDCAQWARLLEAATKERNDLRAEVASMARGYRDLHDMLPGNKDVWSKVDDLRTALATALAERDEARADARLGNEIAAKVNDAVNRAGIHCALYYWEAIDQIAKERDEARAEVKRYRSQLEELTWIANGLKAAGAWKPSEIWREEVADEVAEQIATFVDAEAEVRREEGFSYRAVSELAADIRSGSWRKESK